jgi:hypothetical protein
MHCNVPARWIRVYMDCENEEKENFFGPRNFIAPSVKFITN